RPSPRPRAARARGVGARGGARGQRFRVGGSAVVAGDGVAGGEETLGQGAPHGAQADEGDRGHQPLLAPLNWNMPPPSPRAILPMPSAMRSVVGGMGGGGGGSGKGRCAG